MARTEKIVSVFVASPSDVSLERDKLEEVVREVNKIHARDSGVRIDLVRWETDALPGIGDDAQKVITESVPQDFDIFIGIMWHRFGTPTSTHESGTVEEFERARSRLDRGENVRIMFYFKEAPPLSLREIDAIQYSRVVEFRDNLGKEGVLYSQFTEISDFEKLLRIHLSRVISESKSNSENYTDRNIAVSCDKEEMEEEVLEGIFELIDRFEENFEDVQEIVIRIGSEIGDLEPKVRSGTSSLEEISDRKGGSVRDNRNEAKKVIQRISNEMEKSAERLSVEIPLFKARMQDGLNSFIRMIDISVDLGDNQDVDDNLSNNMSEMEGLHRAITDALVGIGAFREATAGLPRLTGDINRAKRKLVDVLDGLMLEMRDADALLGEAIKAVGGRLRKS